MSICIARTTRMRRTYWIIHDCADWTVKWLVRKDVCCCLGSRNSKSCMLINNSMRCLGVGRRGTWHSFTLDTRPTRSPINHAYLHIQLVSYLLHVEVLYCLVLFFKTCCFNVSSALEQRAADVEVSRIVSFFELLSKRPRSIAAPLRCCLWLPGYSMRWST